MPSRELATLLTALRAGKRRDPTDIPRFRSDFETFMQVLPRVGTVHRREARPAGAPRPWTAEWLVHGDTAPSLEEAPERTILFFHGGGYVIGTLDSYRALAARLGRAAGARVLSVAYRLAPEHPFPAAHEDALDAYRWILGLPDAAGAADPGADAPLRPVAPEHLVVSGDSAGGGLAAALLLAARDAGHPLPAGLLLMSPWTDLAITGESILTKAELDPFFTGDALLYIADRYRGEAPPTHPHVSPLYADLAGLPPTYIQVGSSEVMLSDSTRFADRLEEAEVPVELHVWEQMIHGWQLYAGMLPEADQALEALGGFARQVTAQSS